MSRRHVIFMAVLAATWGASYLFIKVGLRDFSSSFVVFGRTALAAAVLAPLAYRAGALRALRGHAKPITVLALVQVAVPFLLITEGEHHIPTALAGILVASAPIYTALLALRFDASERVGGWAAVGIVVGIVGVTLLFGVDLSGDRDTLIGGLMVLLASLGYSVGALYLKRTTAGVPPVAVATGTMAVSALMLAPFAALSLPTSAGADSVGALLALGALGTGVAFLLFYSLIAEIGASKASIVAYLAPVFAVVYGVTLLGEVISWATLGGLLLILAGSYLGAFGRPPWRRTRIVVPVPDVAADAAAGELSRT
ncbi:DMT family transporter [Paraconexibacter sp.]|uniref:DMT family transporter n=1 Tax=Paraconexibacter sp. TaxID=2949640 RepID=UPI003561F39D